MHLPETPTIPDHELFSLIGKGSYGEVWLARNALGTPRAVKIVRRATFDSDRPYVREFSGIKKFEPISRSHDGLVDILQVGRNDAAGFFYYVMELADNAADSSDGSPSLFPLSGETGLSGDTTSFFRRSAGAFRPRTLASEIKARGHLPMAEALAFFNDLAVAIGHLHSRGLLHRDIKPANVIFVSGVPKLADIGLVAEPGESATFVGTAGFIPPEGPGTVTADLYALGKLMYEAATGRDRQEFPALTLDPAAPDKNAEMVELNEILLRCCDPLPAKRYHNAAELQADLAVLRSGHSVQRLRAFERRFLLARKYGALASLVAAVAVAASLFSRRQERIATENFQRSETLRARAEKAEQEATERLYTSLVERAAAERRSGLVGARERALSAIRQAASLHAPTAELRSEAIAALALIDFTDRQRWKSRSSAPQPLCLSPDGNLIAQLTDDDAIEVRQVSDNLLTARLTTGGPRPEWVGPFSSDNRWLGAVGTNSLHLWEIKTGKARTWPASAGTWRNLRFLRNPATVVYLAGQHLGSLDLETGDSRTWEIPNGLHYASPSPDRSMVALTEDQPETLHLWNLESRNDAVTIPLPKSGAATVVEWSPDGTRVAAGTWDHSVKVWDLNGTNAVLSHEFNGHGAEVTALAWGGKSDLLVSSGWDETSRLWSLVAGRESALFLGSSWAHQFSPSARLFSHFEPFGKEIVLSDLHFNEICRILQEPGPRHEKSPNVVAFSSDSRWVITGCHDGLRAYRASDGSLGAFLPGARVADIIGFPAPSHEFAALTAQGRYLGSWSSKGGDSFEFGPIKETARADFPRHHPNRQPWLGNLITHLALFSADGNITSLPQSASAIKTLVSPGGEYAAATFSDHHAAYWSLGSSPQYHELGPSRGYAVAFSPDSRAVYHATYLDLCKTSTESGQLEWQVHLTPHAHPNAGVEVSPDGLTVAVTMDPNKVSLVNPRDGHLYAVIEHPDRQLINGIAFSPDGAYFAIGCTTHLTQLWDLRRLRAELSAMKLDW